MVLLNAAKIVGTRDEVGWGRVGVGKGGRDRKLN